MNLQNKIEQNLIEEIDRITDYYGFGVAELIPTLDRYLRYYHTTEKEKFELQDAVTKFKNGDAGAGIDNLLQTVENYYSTDERMISVIDDEMFDFERLKEIILALTIYQVRKEPANEIERQKLLKQYADNQHN